tara:strand:- start:12531 stop:12812 length:282 start_codon:yes stop_codon:yes gene_type:complete
MKRILVDYKKLTAEILDLLVVKFPDGYGIRDIVKFTNHKGKYVEAIEVSTSDTIYLVKISNELVDSMEGHDEGDSLDPKIEEINIEDIDLEDK